MNITVNVKIEFSENGYISKKAGNDFMPVDDMNYILRVATWDFIRKNGFRFGYDKTDFKLVVIDHDDNDAEHEYTGRIDIGPDTHEVYHIVQDHIISILEYYLSGKVPDIKFTDEEKTESLQWIELMKHRATIP